MTPELRTAAASVGIGAFLVVSALAMAWLPLGLLAAGVVLVAFGLIVLRGARP